MSSLLKKGFSAVTEKKSQAVLRCGVIPPYSCGYPSKMNEAALDTLIGSRLMSSSGRISCYNSKPNPGKAGSFATDSIGKRWGVVNTKIFGGCMMNFDKYGCYSERMRNVSLLNCLMKTRRSLVKGVDSMTSSSSPFSLIRLFSTDAKPANFDDNVGDGETLKEHHADSSKNIGRKKSRGSKSQRVTPDVLTMTKEAAKRIKELIAGKDDVIGIRITVKKRGCNGYSYNMNYANIEEQTKRNDEIVEMDGVKVFVDPAAVFFIVGTEMNYEETELAAEFTFTNPNSKGECGCGESFNV